MAIPLPSLDDLQEKITSEQQSHFDKLHSAELSNIGKNFTEEERIDMCKVIPSKFLKDELDRRQRRIDEILTALVEKMKEHSDNMDLIDKEQLIADVRQIVRTQ